MMRRRGVLSPSILVGVTAKESLKLLGRFPLDLASQGWDVHLVAEAWSETPNPLLRHHRIRMQRKPSPISDVRALVEWFMLLARLRPDVVAIATPKASLLALIAATFLRVPRRVYFLWGLRFESLVGSKRFFFILLEKLTGVLATEIVSVSPSLSKAHNSFFPNQTEKVTVIGHGGSKGVDLTKFIPISPQEKRKVKKKLGMRVGGNLPIVGYVGRIHPDKGLHLLAEALASLSNRGIDCHLITVGTVEDDGQILEALSQCAAVYNHFDFSGNPETFLQVLDILCLPTLREGLPNVCLEALACGVPVVTTNVTGALDSVAHNVNGLIVDELTPDALGEALERVLQDASLRRKFSRNARAWVAERFSEDKVAAGIAAFFSSLPGKAEGRLSYTQRNSAEC